MDIRDWPLVNINGQEFRIKFSLASSYALAKVGITPPVLAKKITKAARNQNFLELNLQLAAAGLQKRTPTGWATAGFTGETLVDFISADATEDEQNAVMKSLSDAVWEALKNRTPAMVETSQAAPATSSQPTPTNGGSGSGLSE